MASFNKVILMGNLTRDPELRATPSGSSVCRFTIACSRAFKAQDGSQREETAFIDCDAWGRTAETIAKYCQKGRPLLVEGRLRQDKWDDKNTGEKRTKLIVVVDNFSFVSSGRNDGAEGGSPDDGAPAPRAARPQAPAADAPAGADEDIPF